MMWLRPCPYIARKFLKNANSKGGKKALMWRTVACMQTPVIVARNMNSMPRKLAGMLRTRSRAPLNKRGLAGLDLVERGCDRQARSSRRLRENTAWTRANCPSALARIREPGVQALSGAAGVCRLVPSQGLMFCRLWHVFAGGCRSAD